MAVQISIPDHKTLKPGDVPSEFNTGQGATMAQLQGGHIPGAYAGSTSAKN